MRNIINTLVTMVAIATLGYVFLTPGDPCVDQVYGTPIKGCR